MSLPENYNPLDLNPQSYNPLIPNGTTDHLGLNHPKEILFIAPNIDNYQSLIDGINPNIEVIKLDLTQDGVFQISEVLQRYQGIESVYIATHGSQGDLELGSTNLNFNTLDSYESNLTSWGQHLTQNADIILYGCDFAATEEGVSLVQRLSAITGADVAASDDLTGGTNKGGDWDLEVQTGLIEAGLAFKDSAIAGYDSVFASLSGNISGKQQYGNVVALGPVENRDNVTFGGNVTLTGDVTLDVVGNFTLDGGWKISGDGVGDRDSLTINATDTVTINGDIGGGGFKNITIQAPKIKILDNVVISTRLVNGTTSASWLTDASTGDSGSINLNAIVDLSDHPDFFFAAAIKDALTPDPQIEVKTGSKLLAHVLGSDTTNKAGDITLKGEALVLRAGLSIWDYSDKKVDINLQGSTIKGAKVTITANAEDKNPYSEVPEGVQKAIIAPFVQSTLYELQNLLIPVSVQVRGSDTQITINNTFISASGKVDIASTSVVDSSVQARNASPS